MMRLGSQVRPSNKIRVSNGKFQRLGDRRKVPMIKSKLKIIFASYFSFKRIIKFAQPKQRQPSSVTRFVTHGSASLIGDQLSGLFITAIYLHAQPLRYRPFDQKYMLLDHPRNALDFDQRGIFVFHKLKFP